MTGDPYQGAERRNGRYRPMSVGGIASVISVVAFLLLQALAAAWYVRGLEARVEAGEVENKNQAASLRVMIDIRTAQADIKTAQALAAAQLGSLKEDLDEIKAQLAADRRASRGWQLEPPIDHPGRGRE